MSNTLENSQKNNQQHLSTEQQQLSHRNDQSTKRRNSWSSSHNNTNNNNNTHNNNSNNPSGGESAPGHETATSSLNPSATLNMSGFSSSSNSGAHSSSSTSQISFFRNPVKWCGSCWTSIRTILIVFFFFTLAVATISPPIILFASYNTVVYDSVLTIAHGTSTNIVVKIEGEFTFAEMFFDSQGNWSRQYGSPDMDPIKRKYNEMQLAKFAVGGLRSNLGFSYFLQRFWDGSRNLGTHISDDITIAQYCLIANGIYNSTMNLADVEQFAPGGCVIDLRLNSTTQRGLPVSNPFSSYIIKVDTRSFINSQVWNYSLVNLHEHPGANNNSAIVGDLAFADTRTPDGKGFVGTVYASVRLATFYDNPSKFSSMMLSALDLAKLGPLLRRLLPHDQARAFVVDSFQRILFWSHGDAALVYTLTATHGIVYENCYNDFAGNAIGCLYNLSTHPEYAILKAWRQVEQNIWGTNVTFVSSEKDPRWKLIGQNITSRIVDLDSTEFYDRTDLVVHPTASLFSFDKVEYVQNHEVVRVIGGYWDLYIFLPVIVWTKDANTAMTIAMTFFTIVMLFGFWLSWLMLKTLATRIEDLADDMGDDPFGGPAMFARNVLIRSKSASSSRRSSLTSGSSPAPISNETNKLASSSDKNNNDTANDKKKKKKKKKKGKKEKDEGVNKNNLINVSKKSQSTDDAQEDDDGDDDENKNPENKSSDKEIKNNVEKKCDPGATVEEEYEDETFFEMVKRKFFFELEEIWELEEGFTELQKIIFMLRSFMPKDHARLMLSTSVSHNTSARQSDCGRSSVSSNPFLAGEDDDIFSEQKSPGNDNIPPVGMNTNDEENEGLQYRDLGARSPTPPLTRSKDDDDDENNSSHNNNNADDMSPSLQLSMLPEVTNNNRAFPTSPSNVPLNGTARASNERQPPPQPAPEEKSFANTTPTKLSDDNRSSSTATGDGKKNMANHISSNNSNNDNKANDSKNINDGIPAAVAGAAVAVGDGAVPANPASTKRKVTFAPSNGTDENNANGNDDENNNSSKPGNHQQYQLAKPRKRSNNNTNKNNAGGSGNEMLSPQVGNNQPQPVAVNEYQRFMIATVRIVGTVELAETISAFLEERNLLNAHSSLMNQHTPKNTNKIKRKNDHSGNNPFWTGDEIDVPSLPESRWKRHQQVKRNNIEKMKQKSKKIKEGQAKKKQQQPSQNNNKQKQDEVEYGSDEDDDDDENNANVDPRIKMIERSKFIVDTICAAIESTGAHVLEYRNDLFIICLRLSKRVQSKLAFRFVAKLIQAADKIAQHKYQRPFNVGPNRTIALTAGVAIGTCRMLNTMATFEEVLVRPMTVIGPAILESFRLNGLMEMMARLRSVFAELSGTASAFVAPPPPWAPPHGAPPPTAEELEQEAKNKLKMAKKLNGEGDDDEDEDEAAPQQQQQQKQQQQPQSQPQAQEKKDENKNDNKHDDVESLLPHQCAEDSEKANQKKDNRDDHDDDDDKTLNEKKNVPRHIGFSGNEKAMQRFQDADSSASSAASTVNDDSSSTVNTDDTDDKITPADEKKKLLEQNQKEVSASTSSAQGKNHQEEKNNLDASTTSSSDGFFVIDDNLSHFIGFDVDGCHDALGMMSRQLPTLNTALRASILVRRKRNAEATLSLQATSSTLPTQKQRQRKQEVLNSSSSHEDHNHNNNNHNHGDDTYKYDNAAGTNVLENNNNNNNNNSSNIAKTNSFSSSSSNSSTPLQPRQPNTKTPLEPEFHRDIQKLLQPGPFARILEARPMGLQYVTTVKGRNGQNQNVFCVRDPLPMPGFSDQPEVNVQQQQQQQQTAPPPQQPQQLQNPVQQQQQQTQK